MQDRLPRYGFILEAMRKQKVKISLLPNNEFDLKYNFRYWEEYSFDNPCVYDVPKLHTRYYKLEAIEHEGHKETGWYCGPEITLEEAHRTICMWRLKYHMDAVSLDEFCFIMIRQGVAKYVPWDQPDPVGRPGGCYGCGRKKELKKWIYSELNKKNGAYFCTQCAEEHATLLKERDMVPISIFEARYW